MKDDLAITRRDFLRGAAGVLAGAAIGSGIPALSSAEEKARVVLVRHSEVIAANGSVRADLVQSMLDEAVKVLLAERDTAQAWRRLFRKSDVVGVKSNEWHRMPTPKELENAIRRRLLDVGIDEKNISVDDRGVLSNPVFARSTALVNTRPLRTHHWSGVGTCLKNYIMFVPDPPSYHDEGCSPLGKIWSLPMVKGKTRLNVLAALTPQFWGRGAHFFDRRYVWQYKGLIVGTDPVAVDAVGAEVLKRKRVAFFGEDRALDVAPIHIVAADKTYHLGVSDLSRIELVKLGWQDESLV